MFEKPAGMILGLVVAGFVGYKILGRTKPRLLRKIKRTVLDTTDRIVEIYRGAQDSFSEGYAGA